MLSLRPCFRLATRPWALASPGARPFSTAVDFRPCDPGCTKGSSLMPRCRYCVPQGSGLQVLSTTAPHPPATSQSSASGPAFRPCDPACGNGYKLTRCKYCRP
ncbi:hypothetical protein AB1Y20_018005 [Prymnesium parvum]|uniref:Uncharacterized protein n=1 Tax=Prymnesium parvum TaxID=97485 RepID=A0AB34JQU1_PRYPA